MTNPLEREIMSVADITPDRAIVKIHGPAKEGSLAGFVCASPLRIMKGKYGTRGYGVFCN